jgi:hypothetical protein
MPGIRGKAVIVVVTLFGWAAPMAGGEFSDPTGYSFTYPDGWIAVTNPGKNFNQGLLPRETQSWLNKNKVGLDRISMVLVRHGQGEFLENLNVVVDRQQIQVDGDAVRKLLDMQTQQYRSLDAIVEKAEGSLRKLRANKAIVLDYETRLPGVPFPLRQRQVCFPGGGNTYIVTCTAKADTFARHFQTFETILATFSVPPPIAPSPIRQLFDLRGSLVGAIIGAAVGGLIGVILLVVKLVGGKGLKQ